MPGRRSCNHAGAANLEARFSGFLSRKRAIRVHISAELPPLYLQGRHPKAPTVSFLQLDDPITSVRARTTKLEPLPILSSLPVYRYF